MIEPSINLLRHQFDNDPSRPRYHFLPPANWMNDPNGLIQWNGRYHLFYQHNPDAAFHANMNWGHAVSDDLIHWQDLPIALAPSPNSVDEGGIFSGCAVNHDGVPTIFYTGVSSDYEVQVQCVATGDDDLINWTKHAENPVIADVPAEAQQTTEFRDPLVWQEDHTWLMAVGSQIRDVGGAVFLYQSTDALNWEYLHPLYVSEDEALGEVWECPNFFKLGDKWVLIVSSNTDDVTGDVIYFVGDYQEHRFIAEKQGTLDWAYLYAPLTIEDEQGRRLLWAWLREGRSVEAHTEAGWAGVQCFPRVLSLDEHYNLITSPAPEIESIRQIILSEDNVALTDNTSLSVRGLSIDIEAEFVLEETSKIRLTLASSEDGQIATVIDYDATTQILNINRDLASNIPADDTYAHRVNHALMSDENLSLRILLDGSVLEVIANGRTSVTSRIYPTDFDHNYLHVTGQDATATQINIFEVPSIWS
ncbi:MAG: glycoside hydrolase family 32 protein [Chloroflexota bacterium]